MHQHIQFDFFENLIPNHIKRIHVMIRIPANYNDEQENNIILRIQLINALLLKL